MTATDKAFAGAIPELYDRNLVPLIFESYAADMARRVAESAPRCVLETAAGTGVVARALAPLLPASACYAVTDLNQAMLDRAALHTRDDKRISLRQADAQALPFADGAFDIVACQFGVMFLPDRPKAFREAHRVLKPGGRFLFSVWDRIEANAFADVVTMTMAELFPDDPPRFLARTPHGHYDTDRLHDELMTAGFGKIEVATVDQTSRASSPREPAIAYCLGTPLRSEIEARGGNLDKAVELATAALAARYGSGEVVAPIRAHVIAAVR